MKSKNTSSGQTWFPYLPAILFGIAFLTLVARVVADGENSASAAQSPTHAEVLKPADPAVDTSPPPTGFLGGPQPSPENADQIKIIAAKWGVGLHFADVTDVVKGILDEPNTDFEAGTDWLQSDPAAGWGKMLVTTVEFGNQQYIIHTQEGDTISLGVIKKYLNKNKSAGRFENLLPPPPDKKGLNIINAIWGSGDHVADVTDRVKTILNDPKSEFPVDPDWLKSDPAEGWKKTLVITFEWYDKRYTLRVPEDGTLGIRELKHYVSENTKSK